MTRLVLLLSAAIALVMILAEPEHHESEGAASAASGQGTPAAERTPGAPGVTFAPVDERRRAPKALARVRRRDAPAARTQSPEAATHVVTGSVVNMRAGPSTATGVVGQMAEGEAAEMLRRTANGWAKIRAMRSGRTGYMAARFLAPIS